MKQTSLGKDTSAGPSKDVFHCYSSTSCDLEQKDNEKIVQSRRNNSNVVSNAHEKDSVKPAEFSSFTSNEYFVEFVLEVGVRLGEIMPGVLPNVFLRMDWLSGKDRNSMYQLFQYFQNRFRR